MSQGRFITFEGGEGAGKSTQVIKLQDGLKARGVDAYITREPGGGADNGQIRNLLIYGTAERWLPLTELLLLYADRVEHLKRVIEPHLNKGAWVICDRFADSTMAYQGYGMGIELEKIRALHKLVLGDVKPDLTFILDLDPEIGLARAIDRDGGKQRYEAMDLDFHHKLRRGFLEIAKADPNRCVVVDASQNLAEVNGILEAEIAKRFFS